MQWIGLYTPWLKGLGLKLWLCLSCCVGLDSLLKFSLPQGSRSYDEDESSTHFMKLV